MENVTVIGAGPAGLLAAWVARRRGAAVRILASGIGTTHIMPGWIRIPSAEDLTRASAGPERSSTPRPLPPCLLAGMDALHDGLAALRAVGQEAGINYVSDEDLAGLRDLSALSGVNFRLPTALGAIVRAAVVPESFAAGDLRLPGAVLIAGPAGWRDFYPALCAENLARQGIAAAAATFDLPEAHAGRFDATSTGLARLFDRADVRARVAVQIAAKLDGAARVGLPAVLGLDHAAEAWRDLQDRVGVPVFEIPTLPPSVPGMRLFNAFKAALVRAGVQILLDMTAVRGMIEGTRAAGVIVPNVVRDQAYRADTFILATGGLYGGGITSDHIGGLREAVFGLPLYVPGEFGSWFEPALLGGREHAIHAVGVRANGQLQPVDEDGRIVLENVRLAGRLLAGSNPAADGSAEAIWVATACRAAA